MTTLSFDAVHDAATVIGDLRSVFATGRTRSIAWRLEQLEALERLVVESEDQIAEALRADLGRNKIDSWLGDIASVRAEAEYARKNIKRWMRPRRAGLPLAMRPGRAFTTHEPLGVVLVIGPWNYPVYLSLGPIVGAIAAGNCVVLKPSEHAPATSALLARLIPQFMDSDAIAVVEGDAVATQALLAQGVDHAFFTGGPEIGKAIMAAAAPHLTPVTLELGGKSPAIVTRNANLAVAARRIVWTKFVNAGQTCVAPDYVLVDAAVKDEFVSHLDESLRSMRAKEPALMRIVNDRQYQRLAALIPSGGRVAIGGQADEKSHAIAPTVIVDPEPASDLMTNEIFGPILPVVTIDSLNSAIEFVTAREKPLAAYLFSDVKQEHERVINEISSGGVVVNQAALQVLVPQLPFGGVGTSGMGTYHGEYGFQTFSHRKSVLVKPSWPDPALLYPPYSGFAERIFRKLF